MRVFPSVSSLCFIRGFSSLRATGRRPPRLFRWFPWAESGRGLLLGSHRRRRRRRSSTPRARGRASAMTGRAARSTACAGTRPLPERLTERAGRARARRSITPCMTANCIPKTHACSCRVALAPPTRLPSLGDSAVEVEGDRFAGKTRARRADGAPRGRCGRICGWYGCRGGRAVLGGRPGRRCGADSASRRCGAARAGGAARDGSRRRRRGGVISLATMS